jgi:hypothetical protein
MAGGIEGARSHVHAIERQAADFVGADEVQVDLGAGSDGKWRVVVQLRAIDGIAQAEGTDLHGGAAGMGSRAGEGGGSGAPLGERAGARDVGGERLVGVGGGVDHQRGVVDDGGRD